MGKGPTTYFLQLLGEIEGKPKGKPNGRRNKEWNLTFKFKNNTPMVEKTPGPRIGIKKNLNLRTLIEPSLKKKNGIIEIITLSQFVQTPDRKEFE